MVRQVQMALRPTLPTTGEGGQAPLPSRVGAGKALTRPFSFPYVLGQHPPAPDLLRPLHWAQVVISIFRPISCPFSCLISHIPHQGASQGHVLPRLRQLPRECLSLRRAATSHL